ncbi:unnamed protein product [Spirodela intermedia]|uniref:Gnk2-homologous domain-containing protein n=2 Tax=Spirodela intermedia TaxID=51605 RepID=A0A7I8J492_SPIIN|nr:unnamed protein product [Spirodela intermedia]CAA6664864.1 unnamed protein product [Spirodela intermedia]CAA7401483.1 unnamed protein product [Spirodela intermedia]
MTSPPAPVLSLFLLFLLIAYPLCHAAAPLTEYCSYDKKASSAAKANIARVLATLQSNAPSNGFYTASYGTGSVDRAYGLAQCRQDVSVEDCRICLRDAPPQLSKRCKGQAEAWMWFDYCFVRYDTTPFTGKFDSGYGVYDYSEYNVTENVVEQRRFDRELRSLLGKVKTQAAARGNLGLGRDQTKFSSAVTIYALAQCTRDLPSQACSKCLSTEIGYFAQFCPQRKACRGLTSGCYLRYEIYPFFFPLSPGSPKASLAAEPLVSKVVSP